MPDKEDINDSDSVLSVETSHLPESVSEWILKESCDILECSPFLCHISWLGSFSDKLSEIAVSLFGKSSIIL